MYREIISPDHDKQEIEPAANGQAATAVTTVGFGSALAHIIAADVSMSLDNVLAVAGASKGNMTVLIIGLSIAVLLMAVAANYVAKLLSRYPGIMWIGLLIILYVSLDMIWRGSHEVACDAYGGYWCNHNLIDFMKVKAGM